jgi:amidase
MAAHLQHIERINPRVNAIVTLLPERAMDGARAADEALARGTSVGPLHGLPIAHKDLVLTKGIRTTYGSRIYQDFVPDQDALIVQRMRSAGAITLGKTNTPEFGAGSQTFNAVFGATLNPYDLNRTCGGSSGGAAVAWRVACCPSLMAAIWVALCAIPPTSAMSSASARPRVVYPYIPPGRCGRRSRCRGPWRVPCRMWRCF